MDKIKVPLILIIISLWSVWPLIKCSGCVADIGKDGELITWIINTSGKNIYGLYSGSDSEIFDGDMFYPYNNVLAYSDMYFLTAIWTFPISRLIADPLIVNTLAMAVGQLMTAAVTYLWWKKISGNKWAAGVGTAAFLLSPIRMEYQVHLQMWGLQFMLIGCWLISDWLEDTKDWKLFIGTGILGLQVWESLLPVYFALLVLGAKYLVLKPKIEIKKIIIAGLVLGTIAALPLLAYWGVGREFNFRRDIREAAHNGMSGEQVFTKFGSAGLYILFAISVWQIIKSQILNTKSQINSKSQKLNMKWLGLILITSFVLALGPTLKWQGKTVRAAGKIPIPLPYAVAYYLVPGFNALRTPSRWMWVAGWAASGLIALGFSKSQILNPKLQINSKFKILIPSLIFITVVGGTRITKVRRLPTYENMPEVYRQLEKMPGDVVLEVPMGDENIETERMLFSLYHRKKLVNGFSGFTPPEYYVMRDWVNDGISGEEIDRIKKMGVDYIIYDGQEIQSL